jgi:hypothetical protein
MGIVPGDHATTLEVEAVLSAVLAFFETRACTWSIISIVD